MNSKPQEHTEDMEKALEEAVTQQPAEPELDALASAQQELLQMKDQWLRAVADAENTRKRSERETQEARKYAVGEFARDMIVVAENLKRAVESIPANVSETDATPLLKTIYSGVEMTLKELLGNFERHGLKRIDPKGQSFDHNFHQAVAQVEDASVKPGEIVQVIQAGYTLHDRLLCPAMVAVAKPPADHPQHVDTSA